MNSDWFNIRRRIFLAIHCYRRVRNYFQRGTFVLKMKDWVEFVNSMRSVREVHDLIDQQATIQVLLSQYVVRPARHLGSCVKLPSGI